MAKILHYILELLFPDKCIFCQKPLDRGQTDLCSTCRTNGPEFIKSKNKHSFIARWTCLWYYKGDARRSILRYKFYRRTSYAKNFGRLLAMKLQTEGMDDFDLLTWVPISPWRRLTRGFDQVELLAKAVGEELSIQPVRTLVKIRNTPAQSRIHGIASRRANILAAYQAYQPEQFRGKRILLLDDVVTSGATASECAKTLLTAGAKQICLATIATAEHAYK